jgi:hypothetical protein
MEDLLGLLRIRIKRGVNLAVRDVNTSDPYVVVKMGNQKLKTRVIRKDVNPEWNEDLTLSVTEPVLPFKLVRNLLINQLHACMHALMIELNVVFFFHVCIEPADCV